MNVEDSLRLALEAEKHNHRKDNEYLLQEIERSAENAGRLAAENYRLRDIAEKALWKIADGYTDGGLEEDEHPQLVAREALAALKDNQ
jgi:hypothetical protein